MREYILFASNIDYVKTWIELVKRDVLEMLLRLGIKANVERASDPFFNPNDFRQKFQVDDNLKSEFVVRGIAVGSVNFHLKSFTKSCRIITHDGESLYSACFGLGYDRVAGIFDGISSAVERPDPGKSN